MCPEAEELAQQLRALEQYLTPSTHMVAQCATVTQLVAENPRWVISKLCTFTNI